MHVRLAPPFVTETLPSIDLARGLERLRDTAKRLVSQAVLLGVPFEEVLRSLEQFRIAAALGHGDRSSAVRPNHLTGERVRVGTRVPARTIWIARMLSIVAAAALPPPSRPAP